MAAPPVRSTLTLHRVGLGPADVATVTALVAWVAYVLFPRRKRRR